LGDAQKHKHHQPEEVAAHERLDFLSAKNEHCEINWSDEETKAATAFRLASLKSNQSHAAASTHGTRLKIGGGADCAATSGLQD
jgi:hypothetical protein